MQGDAADNVSPSASRPPPVPISSRRAGPNAPPTSPAAQASASGQGRSTLSGLLASRPGNPPIPPSLQAKMAAMLNRGVPNSAASFSIDSAAQALNRASLGHTLPHSSHSFPPAPARGSRPGAPPPAKKNKPGFKLSDIAAGGGAMGAGLGAGRPSLAEANQDVGDTPFANFNKIVDPSGRLNFAGKAVIHASGVDFSNGSSFAINMEQLKLEQELGRGNYGTVKKVLHKPTNVEMAMKEIRLELDSAKLNGILMELDILHRALSPHIVEFYGAFFVESCVYYCMEYMDGGSLASLCCDPPGANVLIGAGRFAPPPEDDQEGVEQRQEMTKPRLTEPLLACIASSMTKGLKFLKDELGVMHRDVKPTNVLVSTKGHVKLCDFGVSGQLEKSIARTNVGCQSYMAPERIKGASPTPNDDTFMSYSVSADIWSLGLSIVELARGRYPYPPETYENVFAQLSAIVDGEAPGLPEDAEDVPLQDGVLKDGEDETDDDDDFKDAEEEIAPEREAAESPRQSEAPAWGTENARKWSPESRDWVKRCLKKNAAERASYAELLEHPWLKAHAEREIDMAGWVKRAMVWRDTHRRGTSWGGE